LGRFVEIGIGLRAIEVSLIQIETTQYSLGVKWPLIRTEVSARLARPGFRRLEHSLADEIRPFMLGQRNKPRRNRQKMGDSRLSIIDVGSEYRGADSAAYWARGAGRCPSVDAGLQESGAGPAYAGPAFTLI
jgi:hypothetical protein